MSCPLLYLQLCPGVNRRQRPIPYSKIHMRRSSRSTNAARRRRLGQRLRTLAMIVLIPLGLAAIFLASYALTCILNGASPNEVLQHLSALGQRLGDVITTIQVGWED